MKLVEEVKKPESAPQSAPSTEVPLETMVTPPQASPAPPAADYRPDDLPQADDGTRELPG